MFFYLKAFGLRVLVFYLDPLNLIRVIPAEGSIMIDGTIPQILGTILRMRGKRQIIKSSGQALRSSHLTKSPDQIIGPSNLVIWSFRYYNSG